MKVKTLDRNKIVRNYISLEVKKYPFALTVWNAGEEIMNEEVNLVFGKNVIPKGDQDDKIVVVSFKDLASLKHAWEKCVDNNFHHLVEVFKNGKQFTF